jgi:hypothetical protein
MKALLRCASGNGSVRRCREYRTGQAVPERLVEWIVRCHICQPGADELHLDALVGS